MISLFGSGDNLLHASDYNINRDSQAYILDKFQSHNLILLGTRHKRQPILELISGLIPNLHDDGVTHLGLEICSDQQAQIDNFLQTGDCLSGIGIHSQTDCPDYRNLFVRLQTIPDSRRPIVTALDLPKSMYRGEVSRECINENPGQCDFRRRFGHLDGTVVMDCDDSFHGWQLGLTSAIAVKPVKPNELVDEDPYKHKEFRKYFRDQHPVVYKLTVQDSDDD
jgi:hypothetical protein